LGDASSRDAVQGASNLIDYAEIDEATGRLTGFDWRKIRDSGMSRFCGASI
jgi:hypothetical protein